MELLFVFLSGLFFTNGVPHFVKGIMGQTHMTPFKRVSSAYLNIVWAFINFALGVYFLSLSGFSEPDIFTFTNQGLYFGIGAFIMAISDAWLFSKPNARLPWHKD